MEVTKNLNNEKVLAPKLRFKEFEDGWSPEKLSNFITFISGYAFNSLEMKSERSKYQLIKMSNVYKSELQLERSPSYWDDIDSKLEKFVLRKNDILLTLTGTVGKQDYGYSVVIPESNKYLLNQRLVCLRYIPNISEGQFINNLIKTSRFYYLFFGESKGGTGNQTNVGSEDLKNIKLNIPSLPEQQKIAGFLSAVDEKIQQLNRKKQLLEQYKKGVMQLLFSGIGRKDAMHGVFTNKNGKPYPKWEEKKLGEVAVKKSSNVVANTIEENEGVYKIYGASGFIKTVDFFNEELPYISIVKDGAGVGRTLLCDAKSSVLGTLDIIKPTVNVNLYFLYTLLNNIRFSKYSIGSTIPHIYFKDYSKEIINLPCLEEQKKIADFLSGIDAKIEGVTNQINQSQQFKKGLLQQMFV